MKDYLRRNWWLYLILILVCAATPVIRSTTEVPMLPLPSAYGTWYFIALPVIAAVIVTVISVRRGRYDLTSVIVLELLLLLSFFVPELISSGGAFAFVELPMYIAIAVLSLPAIAALILSGIAYAIFGRRKTA